MAAYTRAVQLDVKCAKAYFGRGRALRQKKDLDGAVADWSEAIRLDPTYADPHARLGALYYSKGDLKKAMAECSQAIQLNPRDSYAYGLRGTIRETKGEHDLAIADLTEAIRLNPRETTAYGNRGYARMKSAIATGPLRILRRSCGSILKTPRHTFIRAVCLARKRRYDEAIADLGEVMRVKPDDYNGPLYRGFYFARQERYDKAIADLDAAIRLRPDPADGCTRCAARFRSPAGIATAASRIFRPCSG